MIRSNIFVRRMAAAIVPRQHAGAASASSAIDALATTSHRASSTSSAAVAPTPIHSYFSTPAVAAASRRNFSSAAATELGSILQREIEEETEASAEYDGELPPELAELDAEIRKDWTVLEGIGGDDGQTGSGATMRMFRKESGSKGSKIGIVFHCQDTEEDVVFDENEEFEDEEKEEEEEEEAAMAARFGVTVSKGGKTVVLQCRSSAVGDVLTVESVMVRDGDAESVLTALAGGENVHASLYQGPEFTELSEDLQESFQKYVVEECGVDVNVAAFISMYADYREQEEYTSWMKTTIDILD